MFTSSTSPAAVAAVAHYEASRCPLAEAAALHGVTLSEVVRVIVLGAK